MNNEPYKGGIAALDLVKQINPTVGEVLRAEYSLVSQIHELRITGVTDWWWHNAFNKNLRYQIFEGGN
jgi:hypothetical protein